MLNDNEFIRYSRQISVEDFGDLAQTKLIDTRVLIIGCGGLGNIVAAYLVGAGVKRIVLADGDKLEVSNLQRQICFNENDIGKSKSKSLKQNLQQINSECRLSAIEDMLTGERLVLEVMVSDLVIDCSDNFKTCREINRACNKLGIPHITGSASGWKGQVMFFLNTDNSPCYECLYPENNQIDTKESCSSFGVIGPVVGTIGSMQALMAIQYLSGVSKVGTHELHGFDGLLMENVKVTVTKNEYCRVCKKEFK